MKIIKVTSVDKEGIYDWINSEQISLVRTGANANETYTLHVHLSNGKMLTLTFGNKDDMDDFCGTTLQKGEGNCPVAKRPTYN